jgi:hypothetical protein
MVINLEEILYGSKDILKIAICSYAVGFVVGFSGKAIGGDVEKTASFILPFLDLTMGHASPYLIPYSLGVVTNYFEKILNEINF